MRPMHTYPVPPLCNNISNFWGEERNATYHFIMEQPHTDILKVLMNDGSDCSIKKHGYSLVNVRQLPIV